MKAGLDSALERYFRLWRAVLNPSQPWGAMVTLSKKAHFTAGDCDFLFIDFYADWGVGFILCNSLFSLYSLYSFFSKYPCRINKGKYY